MDILKRGVIKKILIKYRAFECVRTVYNGKKVKGIEYGYEEASMLLDREKTFHGDSRVWMCKCWEEKSMRFWKILHG